MQCNANKCGLMEITVVNGNRPVKALEEKGPWQIHQEDISIVVQEYCYLGCVFLQKDLELSRMALPLATKWLVGNQIDTHTNVALRSRIMGHEQAQNRKGTTKTPSHEM